MRARMQLLARITVATALSVPRQPALEEARALLAQAREARAAGDYAIARVRVAGAFERLVDAEDASVAVPQLELAWEIGTFAERAFDLTTTRRSLEHAEAGFAARLVAGDRRLRNLRTQLAMIQVQLGDLAAARLRSNAAVAGWSEPSSDDAADWLRAQTTDAAALEWSQAAVARERTERALHATAELLPALHFDALTAKHCLAIYCNTLGDPESARKLEEEVVAGYERTLGADHPYLLYARTVLGLVYYNAGQLEHAR